MKARFAVAAPSETNGEFQAEISVSGVVVAAGEGKTEGRAKVAALKRAKRVADAIFDLENVFLLLGNDGGEEPPEDLGGSMYDLCER